VGEMAFFWKDEYSTNIAIIDEQHKRLLDLGSKLYYQISLKDGVDHYDEIMKVLSDLKNYTIYHFKCEEELLEKYGYEDITRHKIQHAGFINKILQIEKEDIDMKQEKISMEIIVFIADWITNHILKTDHQYKDFLHEKGIQ
jgi:hemerythrin